MGHHDVRSRSDGLTRSDGRPRGLGGDGSDNRGRRVGHAVRAGSSLDGRLDDRDGLAVSQSLDDGRDGGVNLRDRGVLDGVGGSGGLDEGSSLLGHGHVLSDDGGRALRLLRRDLGDGDLGGGGSLGDHGSAQAVEGAVGASVSGHGSPREQADLT